MSNELTTQQQPAFDLSPKTFEQALKLADYLAGSEMVPKQYRGRPGDCFISIGWGLEVGLKPLQALQSIAAVNGKPSLYGDAGKALLLSHGCIIEEDDTAVVKANGLARCKITRPGRKTVDRTFSIDDAKTAGLWGKEGPWKTYPYRQMAWRAFWFAARDAASDILRGMSGYEEGIDTPAEKHMGAADVVQPTAAMSTPASAAAEPLPVWPADSFSKQLPRWTQAVQAGIKTIADIEVLALEKGQLTPEQLAGIRGIRTKGAEAPTDAKQINDPFVDDMNAAEIATK